MLELLFINTFINSTCFILEPISRTRYKLGIHLKWDISQSQTTIQTYTNIPRVNFRVANPSRIFGRWEESEKPGGNPHRQRTYKIHSVSRARTKILGPVKQKYYLLHHCVTMVEFSLHEIIHNQ